jgi:hypothetical protein
MTDGALNQLITIVFDTAEPPRHVVVTVKDAADDNAAEASREFAAGAFTVDDRRTEPVVFEPIVLELCEELAVMVRANGFSVGKLGPAWWTPCEQLLRIGPPNAGKPVTPEQIRKAIVWANNDGFWRENIRSMKQLREKYEQLRSASLNPDRQPR